LRRATGKKIANEHLLIANRSASGLFYTWLVPRLRPVSSLEWWRVVLTDITIGRLTSFWNAGAKRDDIDSVVNANVVRYLAWRPETEAAIRWLHEVASQGKEKSSDKWYRSAAAFYYAVSRCHAARIEGMSGFDAPFERYLESKASLEANDLEAAMILCSLQNFKTQTDAQAQVATRLLASQSADGGWASFPVYFDGRDEPLISWGSRAVTTGFCLQALVRLDDRAS
jgi:hypothetical protein